MAEYNLTGCNNVLIGNNAGVNLTTESNVVIIGDNIKDLSKGNKDVLYITDKVIIGKTVHGYKVNLYDVLIKHIYGI